MTIATWLTQAFWLGLQKWIERDPVAAADRAADFFATVIEQIVAAQEAAALKQEATGA